ncbi:hypothetical protein SAMN05444483_101668 [Salegentibacter echinorum]|uniref:Uncharacterized protein n=2 Tax=Salegentibacter echinorum TaxID=1073325 RepID=A0A1M5CTZ8_SALEC|nr:hypothetical protein SAMN05444483_101668 [Salegentibacter echinorum]
MLTRPLWPVIEYVVNYNYIVEVLCENKDKPEMECDGKCYLSKQLAKQTESVENNPFQDIKKIEIPQFIIAEEIAKFNFYPKTNFTLKKVIGYKPNLKAFQFTSKIFHPPQLG